MSKLLKFKDYVSLTGAARYLGTLLGEEITEDDVVELVENGHLTASVIAHGWACYISEVTESSGVSFLIWKDRKGGAPDDYLYGVYPITPASLDPDSGSITVIMENGQEARCYEVEVDDTETFWLSNERLADNARVPERLDYSMEFLRELAASPLKPIPYEALKRPSIGLDDLVFLPEHLLEFAAKANDTAPEKPLDYRERESMERIILALAKEAGLNLTEPFKAAAVLQAAAACHRVDLPKSKDNIAGKLRAAARHDIYN